MHPTESQLIARHLDPYRVDGIGRHRLDIGHHDTFVFPQGDGVFLPLLAYRLYLYRHHLRYCHILWLLGYHHQRVACHHEVVVLGIVMGGIKGDGVELLLRKIPGVGSDRATIVAGDGE